MSEKKICIPANSSDENAMLDGRFGRAPFFCLYTPGDNTTRWIPNSLAAEASGVGPKVVQILVKEGITELVAGAVGGNAGAALQAAGITVHIQAGALSVQDIINTYRTESTK